tara:strand:- start:12501 stop:12767 length:267 start_codon:yes stop_codon:yes gene_type:complete
MPKQYKVIVPKAGKAGEAANDVRLYERDSIVTASEGWQSEEMDRFVANGWAMEVKVDAPDEVGAPEQIKAPKKKAARKKAARKKAAKS